MGTGSEVFALEQELHAEKLKVKDLLEEQARLRARLAAFEHEPPPPEPP